MASCQLSLRGAGLPLRRVGVKEDGAEGRQDLGGGGRGELPCGHEQTRSVASPQGENQAEGGRTAAVTLFV